MQRNSSISLEQLENGLFLGDVLEPQILAKLPMEHIISPPGKISGYRAEKKGLYVVVRYLFLSLLSFYAWP